VAGKAKNQAACEDCGDTIDVTAPGVAQHVSGWAINRKGGAFGSNFTALPERHLRWLCRFCVDRRRAGVNPAQQELFP
jgi:hypothetical protein